MPLTRFDLRIRNTPEPWKRALIDVCDTAEAVKLWFDDQEVSYTGADITEMTKLVLQREKEVRPVETDGE